ncbi:MAG: class I tRNA ligase family protein, partial [Alphaproteobacteria bacterium]|nr:class I tRNA ligase family protein [Alphaproteobacteria bacterium]
SAMAIDRLGEHLDLHTGGIDFIRGHHANEIAQSDCALGHRWCGFWTHMEFLNDKTGKMSKSKGDFLTLTKLKEMGYDPMDYRFYCLTASYRKQVDFSFEAMDGAKKTRENIVKRVAALLADPLLPDDSLPDVEEVDAIRAKFLSLINDDLNTAAVLAEMQTILKDSKLSDKTKLEAVKFADELLGLRFMDYAQTKIGNEEVHVDGEILKLVQARAEAKAAKDFARADEIRAEINALGFDIKDVHDGTKITRRGE